MVESRSRALGAGALGALLGVLWCTGAAGAQELSPEERLVAAEAAYDRGSRAYRETDYLSAARWYERADELEPAATALRQAVRAYREAGYDRRAATLAAHLLEREGPAQAGQVSFVDEVADESFVLEVACDGCAVEVDGQEERYRTFYLTPNVDHAVVVRFETGERVAQVRGEAGERRVLPLEEPQPDDPTVETRPDRPTPASGLEDDGDGIAPTVFYLSAALTGVVAAVTVWSAIDTQSAADAYDERPTLDALDEGGGKETRTNLLLGATAGLAAVTVAIGLMVDWEAPEQVSVAAAPDGLAVGWRGHW